MANKPESGAHPFGGETSEKPELKTRRARFRYWFDNVFWYHYKWAFLGGIAALVLIAFFVSDMLSQTKYDFQYVVASVSYVDGDSLHELNSAASEAFRDADSGRPAASLGHAIFLGGDGEMNMAAFTKMAAFLVDDSIKFYIFDAELQEGYFGEDVGYADLEKLGYLTVEGTPWLADVSGSPLLERAGLGGVTCYAAVRLTKNANEETPAPDPRHLGFLDMIFNTP